MPEMLWTLDEYPLGFVDRDSYRGFLQLTRLWFPPSELRQPHVIGARDPVIVVNAAKGRALREGDDERYESWLFPAQNKWMWRIAWSVARRLFDANPNRPAIIADGEWNAFEHVELSAYHQRCIGHCSPLPGTAGGAL